MYIISRTRYIIFRGGSPQLINRAALAYISVPDEISGLTRGWKIVNFGIIIFLFFFFVTRAYVCIINRNEIFSVYKYVLHRPNYVLYG